jgi:hypothetical protein
MGGDYSAGVVDIDFVFEKFTGTVNSDEEREMKEKQIAHGAASNCDFTFAPMPQWF